MSSLVNIATAVFTAGVGVYGAHKMIMALRKEDLATAGLFAIVAVCGATSSGLNIAATTIESCPEPVSTPAQGAVIRIPGEIPQVTQPLPVQKERAPAVML